eukprot:scaffold76979_cov47-Attheya_sp.AAC.1
MGHPNGCPASREPKLFLPSCPGISRSSSSQLASSSCITRSSSSSSLQSRLDPKDRARGNRDERPRLTPTPGALLRAKVR